MKLTPSEGVTSSHAIFTGEVTKIAPNEATKFGGLEVTLRVKKVWKGALGDEVQVHTAGSSAACGYGFAMGQTYLVYATSDEADPMRVSLCSRTALVESAEEDLAFLGKPEQQFDDPALSRKSKKNSAANKKDNCSAAPGPAEPEGLGWMVVLLAGAALTLRRFV